MAETTQEVSRWTGCARYPEKGAKHKGDETSTSWGGYIFEIEVNFP